MITSFAEAQAYLRENQTQMVDLKFSDLWGRWRHVSVPAAEFNEPLVAR